MKNLSKESINGGADDTKLMNQPLNDENKMLIENEIAVECGSLIRFNGETPLELGSFISAVTNVERLGALMLLKIVTDELKIVADEEEIIRYNMLSDVLSKPKNVRDTTIANHSVTLIVTYMPLDAKMAETLTITINYEGETETTFYFRVTYTEQPNKINNTYDIGDDKAYRPHSSSTMIAFDKVNDNDKLAEFEFMINDATDKIKSGRENELTELQKYALKCCELDIDENAYYGRKMFNEGRFVEALPYLRSVHRKMQSNYLTFNNDERVMFNEMLYMIGFCYCELHQYEKACFYLDFAEASNVNDFIKYKTEYFNSLANSGDVQSLIETFDFIEFIDKRIENEGITDEDKKELSKFRTFLMRRHAYNCVEHGYYDDAEKCLKELLEDPESEGYALRELNYLKKRREEDGNA